MKKVLFLILGILLAPAFIFAALVIALYIPGVQQFCAEEAARIASRELGMEVSIGHFGVGFPMDAVLEDFHAEKGGQTVLDAASLRADVELLPLLKSHLHVDALELKGVRVNTLDLIDAASISGTLERFSLVSHYVDLGKEDALLNSALLLGAHMTVEIRDSVPEDTTSEPSAWKVRLEEVRLENSDVRLLMDSMAIGVGIGKASASDVGIDLLTSLYSVSRLSLDRSSFSLDMAPGQGKEGLDPEHLAFSDISLDASDITSQSPDLSIMIGKASMRERCGLEITSLSGKLRMDSTSVYADGLRLSTPNSSASLDADVCLSSLDEKGDGKMDVSMKAQIGREDVMAALGPRMARRIRPMYPAMPIRADIQVKGNMRRMEIARCDASLGSAAKASLSGAIESLMDERGRRGNLLLAARGNDLSFIRRIVPDLPVSIPSPVSARAGIRFSSGRYEVTSELAERDGRMSVRGSYGSRDDSYDLDMDIDSVNIHDFLSSDSLFAVSGHIHASGHGFDLARDPQVQAQASITSLDWRGRKLSGISADISLADRILSGSLISENSYLSLGADIAGYVSADSSDVSLDLGVDDVSLLGLGIGDRIQHISFALTSKASSNMHDALEASLGLSKMRIATEKRTFTPKDLDASCLLRPDTLMAHMDAGDLHLKAVSSDGYNTLLEAADSLEAAAERLWQEKRFAATELSRFFPSAHLELSSGRDNPLANYMMMNGFAVRSMAASMDMSKDSGIRANAHAWRVEADSVMLDTIRLDIRQEGDIIRYDAQVRNNRSNRQYVFNFLAEGAVIEDGAVAHLTLYDGKNEKGVDMGMRGQFTSDGIRFSFRPDRPLIAYHTFNLDKDAFILYHDDGRIEGNMDLIADDGSGLRFHASPGEGERQNMSLDIEKIDLGEFISVMPYLPRITGIANGHLEARQPEGGRLEAKGTVSLADLTYENSPMGTLDMDLSCTPDEGEKYRLDATMRRNGVFICSLGGLYDSSSSSFEMDARLIRFPAEMVNGFIPDGIVGMRGIMEGSFRIGGTSEAPVIDGTLSTDSVSIYSDMYGFALRMEDRKMDIKGSVLDISSLALFSETNDKLTVNGKVDFSDLDRIMLNISMRARNFQLINRPRNISTVLYGKAFINLDASVGGTLDEMRMTGNVSLLGSSDVTYVLKDSPLTVEDRLSDLVTFMDFSDTLQVEKAVDRKAISGMDMRLNISISEGAKVSCDLSNNRESYVDLVGGGSLVLSYTPEGAMSLNGRYTINEGEMKYALPVIPLKTFALKQGSYVEFTGDVMNPKLSITATESVKASVSEEGGSARSVLFNVGVEISKTLKDMGLAFTIDAPDDMTVQNELSQLGSDQRGKMAVTMLATGLYLSDSNASGNISMSSALNSFLQSEISSIAGSALQSVDLKVGVEGGTASDGSQTTDYSFRFAKRLWGNRVSIIIGGKISTGSSAKADDSFIDDVSIEYRLDDSGTRYLRLFHERNYDTLLDGEIEETGGGVVLRKKMTRLGELFIFRSKERERRMRERQRREDSRLDAEHGRDASGKVQQELDDAQKERDHDDERQMKIR